MVCIKEGDIFPHKGIILVRKTKEKRKNAKYFMLEPADVEILKAFPKTLPDIPFFRHIRSCSGVKAGTPFGKTMFAQWWRKACSRLGISNVGLYAGTKHTTVTCTITYKML